MATNNKLLILTDAHRKQMEAARQKLAVLKREMAGLQESGILDCCEYQDLCDFVSASLTKKLEYFFPRGQITRAKKGGDE